jgi:hypothetical protein
MLLHWNPLKLAGKGVFTGAGLSLVGTRWRRGRRRRVVDRGDVVLLLHGQGQVIMNKIRH